MFRFISRIETNSLEVNCGLGSLFSTVLLFNRHFRNSQHDASAGKGNISDPIILSFFVYFKSSNYYFSEQAENTTWAKDVVP